MLRMLTHEDVENTHETWGCWGCWHSIVLTDVDTVLFYRRGSATPILNAILDFTALWRHWSLLCTLPNICLRRVLWHSTLNCLRGVLHTYSTGLWMELLTVLTWTGPNSTPQQNDGIWLQLNQKQSRHTAYTAYLLNTHLIPSRAAYLLNASHPLLSLTHVVLQVYSIPSTPENCSCVWMNALTNKQESIHGHSVDIHTTKAQHPFQPALAVWHMWGFDGWAVSESGY